MPTLEKFGQTWDLDVFFPGGSASPQFAAFLARLEEEIAALTERIRGAQVPQSLDAARAWSSLLDSVQDIAARLRQAGAFASCLNAQDVKDAKARLLSGRISQIGAAFATANTLLDSQIVQIPELVWEDLLAQESWAPVAGPMRERRRRAGMKMDPGRESLAGELGVDGYHAWGRLYDTIVGRMSVPWEVEGEPAHLSMGQLFNKFSHKEKAVRDEAFARWQKAWEAEAELCAEALNHLGGFRLALYRHRGWESVLGEPLETNRMTAETLEVMWDVIERNKEPFVRFLGRKASLLGQEKLGWQDVTAPIGKADRKVSFDEAATFIIEQFGRFSPRMAEFATRTFTGRWIEAENRPGKRPGGFCTSFPLSRQSRIFLTFAGNPGNVATLAHELGHAWHQHVMNDLPQMAQGYAMNVAETASTFAEMIMVDAALRAAPSDEERILLLEDKVRRGVAFFMNIHARFLFELDFYEQRRQGQLGVAELGDLMARAQQRAYRNALKSWEPNFWASKLHFYLTHQPFYNFPYTFGYLFSTGVNGRAQAEGPAFEPRYADLLRDTGRMRVEDLARKHLGADLTRPEFWQSAVDVIVADVEEFLRLTER